MADQRNRRLPQSVLQSDLEALAALETITEYKPSNAAYDLNAGLALRTAMQSKQNKEVQDKAAADASRDAAVGGEWDTHDFVQGMKIQIKAQFGVNSDQLAAVGLKKKSEYKSPKPKKPISG